MKLFTSLLALSALSPSHALSLRSQSRAVSEDSSATQYWWKYSGSDCGYDDVSPQPTCGAAHKGDVAGLQACCLATSGCGGFNTNGIIKKTDCVSHVAAAPCDLYVLESTPQPVISDFPPVWPAPMQYTNGTDTVTVSGKTTFTLAGAQKNPTLEAAFARYQALTFPHVTAASEAEIVLENIFNEKKDLPIITAPLAAVTVHVDDLDESHPQLETDETYTLSVPSDGTGATITAKTIYGAMHGLETFSQLVRFDFETETYIVPSAPWTITDAPRFPHRGLMMDTARHFQTLQSIRDMIDSLPYAKINVLHWHMSDSQSFPMQSHTHPFLWNGSWSKEERYTQQDIASIVEYARLRGIGVMVEFDMPGHAASWCTGYPEICPSTSCNQPLNVANNQTFDLIKDVLGEMTGGKSSAKDAPSGLFPKNMVHLGGDEVNTGCWTSTPSVNQWLTDHNMTADEAYGYFTTQVADIAIKQGRRPVQWSEVFDHFGTDLPKDVIVHIWKSVTNVTQVVADGYNVILNVGYDETSWYLDNLNVDWKAVYAQDPCGGSPADLCKLILGGHGEMWGETVDASDFEQTVWPRLGAIAEKLWSPSSATITSDIVEPRMEEFRCLLNRRGVKAAPPKNANARSSPPGPGSCLDQRRYLESK